MTVEKKRAESLLVIQGVLSLHGENFGETTYEWCYGGTTVLAQAEGYTNNTGYHRATPTNAIISGHTQIGKQELSLRWRMRNSTAGRPCNFINPSETRHPQLRQGKSVIIVMEISET